MVQKIRVKNYFLAPSASPFLWRLSFSAPQPPASTASCFSSAIHRVPFSFSSFSSSLCHRSRQSPYAVLVLARPATRAHDQDSAPVMLILANVANVASVAILGVTHWPLPLYLFFASRPLGDRREPQSPAPFDCRPGASIAAQEGPWVSLRQLTKRKRTQGRSSQRCGHGGKPQCELNKATQTPQLATDDHQPMIC